MCACYSSYFIVEVCQQTLYDYKLHFELMWIHYIVKVMNCVLCDKDGGYDKQVADGGGFYYVFTVKYSKNVPK